MTGESSAPDRVADGAGLWPPGLMAEAGAFPKRDVFSFSRFGIYLLGFSGLGSTSEPGFFDIQEFRAWRNISVLKPHEHGKRFAAKVRKAAEDEWDQGSRCVLGDGEDGKMALSCWSAQRAVKGRSGGGQRAVEGSGKFVGRRPWKMTATCGSLPDRRQGGCLPCVLCK